MDERQRVNERLARATKAMDAAQAAFDAAEEEWIAANRECDRLDGITLPTAEDVRGILKSESK